MHADLLHPAESMNQITADLGIPIDSERSKSTLSQSQAEIPLILAVQFSQATSIKPKDSCSGHTL
jgi:hypothetical protein